MKYHDLEFEEILGIMERLTDNYQTIHLEDENVKKEVIDGFFECWDNVTLSGMSKTETNVFIGVLSTIYDLITVRRFYEENQAK